MIKPIVNAAFNMAAEMYYIKGTNTHIPFTEYEIPWHDMCSRSWGLDKWITPIYNGRTFIVVYTNIHTERTNVRQRQCHLS